jgi:hypothetical protein
MHWTRSSRSRFLRRDLSVCCTRPGDAAALYGFLHMLCEQGATQRQKEPRLWVPNNSSLQTRSDAGYCRQLCSFIDQFPLCTISADSHKRFSILCSGRNGLRSAPGSQTFDLARSILLTENTAANNLALASPLNLLPTMSTITGVHENLQKCPPRK